MAGLIIHYMWTWSTWLLLLIPLGLCQQFAVQPVDTVVSSGENVILNCSINNLGAGRVDWSGPPANKQYTLGTQVAPGLVGIGLTGNHAAGEYNLQIANAQRASNAGTYTCSVGALLSSADITITDPATDNSTQLENTGAPALDRGTKTNLTCSVYKTFPRADITWLEEIQAGNKANTSLSQTTSEQSFTDSGLTYYNTTSTLTVIWRSSPSQVSYWCHVQPGNIWKELSVTFNTNPNITSGLGNETLEVGLSKSFICEVAGFPTPDIKWIKEDTGETVSNSSFLNITNAALSDSGWYICNASSSNGMFDYAKMYLQVIGAPSTTTTETYTSTKSSVPPNPMDSLTIAMVVVAASSFIINLFICIIVYKIFPDEIVAVTAAVSWVCIILTTCFVVLGDVCGIVAWTKIDPGQQIGIIVMAVILIDLGFFILGIVVGTVRGSNLQKAGSEETRTVVLRKLVHVVWSVATFGGVTLGIVIKYKHKVQDPNTRTANGGRKLGSNSVMPEAQDPPSHKSDNSKDDSEASQSKVPLHEEKEWVSEKEKETVPMKEVKKKKKKKKASKVQYPVQPVETHRELPPLRKVEKTPLV